MQRIDFLGSLPLPSTTRAISAAMGCACGEALARSRQAFEEHQHRTCRLVDALSESKKMWPCAPSDTAIAEMFEKLDRGTRSDLLKTIM
jgi:hypothetical protein